MDGVILLTVIGAVVFMGLGIAGPMSSLYAEYLQANYFVIGLLSTVGSLTSFLSAYFWGRQSDRLARRKVFMVGGLAGVSLSAGLTALIPNYIYLFPLRVLSSMSMAAYNTIGLALIGDLLERRRGKGRIMGIYRGLSSLSFALMAFVGGSIADRTSLRVPFALQAGFLVLAFCLSLRINDAPFGGPSHPQSDTKTLSDGAVATTEPSLSILPLLASGLILSLTMSATLSVWANYLVNEKGFTATMVTRLWSLTALSEFPFFVTAGWLSDRIGRLPILTLGLLGWVAVLLGYALIPVYPWILLIQLVRGFAFSAFTATAMVYITEASAQAERGRTSGVYSTFRGLGSIVGGTFGGFLSQRLGFVPMVFICAALLFGGAIYLAGTHLHRRGV